MNLSELIKLYSSVLEVHKKELSKYGNSLDYNYGFHSGIICGYEHLLNDLKELDN